MKKVLIIFVISGYLISCSNQDKKVDKSKLTGYDYRLFQDTPAWTLAKAVKAGDISSIRKEVLTNKIDPDYQESRYGNTLLMLSIFNNNYTSTNALLEVGADPNLRDRHRGANAVIDAAKNSDPRYLELLLVNGGEPNVVENELSNDDDSPLQTALTSAISYSDPNSFEKVKLLIEAGADVNFPNDNDHNTELPIGIALKRDRMDIALFFLKIGADHEQVMYKMINGHDVYILEALRKSILELQSPEYQRKLEIVAFLKGKGLNYSEEPIPDYIFQEIKENYPKDWEEYARKY